MIDVTKIVASDQGAFIRLPPQSLHLCAGGRTVMAFHHDGTVTTDPSLKPDEAARQIIALLVSNGWLKYATPHPVAA